LQHLTALSEHAVWVVCAGPAPGHSQPKELFHSVDDGKRWALVAATSFPSPAPGLGALPASGIVTLLTSVSPDRLVIAFDQGSPIASTDGGHTWKPQGLPASGTAQLSFTDAQHGWAVLYPENALYRTSDGGLEWTRASS
jgi:photosystem II stability/assembly factor-like uncharacterized protein